MINPYKVLGVDSVVSDDEVKNAYRRLAEKYSAENYAGNPLADLAEKKMKEIDEAFDRIMAERRTGAPSSQESSSHGSDQNMFGDIRRLIGANNIDEAENRLLAVPSPKRNAEWHFLMGSVNYAKGWLDEACSYFSQAASMEPENREYAAAHNRLRNGRQGHAPGEPFGGYNPSRHDDGCSGHDICTGLFCADCLCRCIGGRGLCC